MPEPSTSPNRDTSVLGVPGPVAQVLGYALVAVLCAWMALTGLWSSFRVFPELTSPWWTLVTALPAAALALAKRRAPLAGCIAAAILFTIDLLTAGGIVPFIVMLDLLYALTVALDERGRRWVLAAVTVATAVITLVTQLVTGELRITVVMGLQFGALLGTTYWYGTAVAQSRELVELHRRQAQDAKRLAELDRSEAVRGERERMARELHDVVAGHVAAVAIRSEAALSADESVEPDESGASGTLERAALRAVRDSSLEAHAALRTMISVLRDGSGCIAAPPGHDRIEGMVEAARGSGVRVALNDSTTEILPEPVGHTVARVVQESLTNAMKHASGAEIDVVISEGPAAVRVEVVSRGGEPIGRPELGGSGMGLRMLEERVRALGGDFAAGRESDRWIVRADVPMGRRDA